MPGVRAKLKTDVDDIKAHNPNIIYVSGSGYGARGPDRDAGGYDILGYWYRGTSGISIKPLDADQIPGMPAPAYGDTIGAMTIAGGISAALFHRERTGEADVVDVSLMNTGMWAMGAGISVSQLNGVPWHELAIQSMGQVTNPIVGCYKTRDGKYLALAMLQGFYYWPEACERLGIPELVGDPRFDSAEKLMANAPEAAELVAAAIAGKTLAEWKERLYGMKGQWSPVLDTMDVADDPQTLANGYLQEVQSKDGHPFTLVSTPVQFNGEPAPTKRGPEFNEHGDEILTGMLGLDWDTILDLKVKGIVG
jgi:crotonobetainyl-CoA:carnitine CoA-transferase CaiB-like acyl-CoA transferase